MRAFCLNFGGRVTVASVKNFQLVALSGSYHDAGGGGSGSGSGAGRGGADEEVVVLQFGKTGDGTF